MTDEQRADVQDYFNKGIDLSGLLEYIDKILTEEGDAHYEQGHAEGMENEEEKNPYCKGCGTRLTVSKGKSYCAICRGGR